MKTIAAVCRAHRRRCYFDDGEGLIGVYNHRNVVLWYRWTEAGYSVTGSTNTPERAQLRYLS